MFLPKLTGPNIRELIAQIGQIDEFKGAWNAGRLASLSEERLLVIRDLAAIQSTASACRLSGHKIAEESVARLVSARQGAHTSRELRSVAGYRRLLAAAHAPDAQIIPLSTPLLADFHATLFGDSVSEADRASRTMVYTSYRHRSGPDVSNLVDATLVAFDLKREHPLLVIARFVVGFLSHRPFPDGNGRVASALATFLLVKHGYVHLAYAPLERIVEHDEATFRAALKRSLTGLKRSPVDYGRWTIFFVEALRRQQHSAEAAVINAHVELRITDTQRRILGFIRENDRATTTILATHFDMPERTLRYNLGVLRDHGLIEAHSDRRGRVYTLPALTRPREAGH